MSCSLEVFTEYRRVLHGVAYRILGSAIGVVREMSINPNFRYRPQLAESFEQARAARRGLWGSCIS